MHNITISQDTLWKGIIEDLFEDFLWYFYPEWAKSEIDFSKGFEFLDKELEDLLPSEIKQKRFADKLVKIHLKQGEEVWMLLHIEIQGYPDTKFAERMFNYFYRIKDRWKKNIMAIAIFTDANTKHHQEKYSYQYQKTKLVYKFETFKLVEKTLEELDIPKNPFSIVMLTAKKALEQQGTTDEKQLIWKIALIKKLKEANYSQNRIRNILNFIRFYVKFEEAASLKELDQSIQQIFKQRKNMGIEEAILKEVEEKGIEQGIEQGIGQGIEQGITLKNIKGVQKALTKGKYSLEEIADLFEVSIDFVMKVQNREIKNP
jgi:predicted transposase/invertase (TIGR01784 family)